MGRLFASLAPYMLLAIDEIAPGGSAAPGGSPAAPPGTGAEVTGNAPQPGVKPNPFDDPIVGARIRSVRATAEKEARAKALAELGIDDPAKFKAEREEKEKRLAEYERAQEDQKRASMTEVDRLKADLAAKDQRIAELEAQIRSAQAEAQSTRFDVVVQKTIGEHVHEDMQEFAAEALRRHLKTLPKDQLRKFGEVETKAFFAKLVKDKPRLAREHAVTPKVPAVPVKRPLTNGASPRAATPPGPAQPPNGKKPASQMTRDEYKAAWAKHGARIPG